MSDSAPGSERGLPAALRSADLAQLWDRIRARLENNGGAITAAPVRLVDCSAAERDAIAGLLGRPRAVDGSVSVRLDFLDAALRAGATQLGLIEVLARIGGPLRDRRDEREQSRQTKEAEWVRVAAHPLVLRDARIADWIDRIRRTGVATRAAADGVGASIVARALDVLDRLPADGLHLARLAAEVSGDAHALDRNQPFGAVVTNALSHLEELPVPASAGRWRELWESVGVVCDELSCDVLALNLPAFGDSLVARTLRDHAAAGEPMRLTLRQLSREQRTAFSATVVYVCENPVVMGHVANGLGRRSAPLVCVDGMPNTAARRLFAQLALSQCRLQYHGDFDWGGLRIANVMVAQLGAEPWRMATADYRAAAQQTPRPGVALGPRPVSASWEANLATAMTETGIAIHEEQLLETLTADLARDEGAIGRGVDASIGQLADSYQASIAGRFDDDPDLSIAP